MSQDPLPFYPVVVGLAAETSAELSLLSLFAGGATLWRVVDLTSDKLPACQICKKGLVFSPVVQNRRSVDVQCTTSDKLPDSPSNAVEAKIKGLVRGVLYPDLAQVGIRQSSPTASDSIQRVNLQGF